MERQAFARALRFLNYLPVAKWTALIASISAGVLFVILIGILALFTDLLVSHGEIPSFAQLPSGVQRHFRARNAADHTDATAEKWLEIVQQRYRTLVEDGEGAEMPTELRKDQLEAIAGHEPLRNEFLWLTELPGQLEASVGAEAAAAVRAEIRRHLLRQGLDRALITPLHDFGILSLVVRTKDSVQGHLVAPLARFNPWMWRYGNHHYLQGLFLAALGLAAVRMAVIFLANYLAALATLEAVTRLRRAIYHHSHRLGPLAVQNEAVSMSTRHLEVVHDGLYTWLTVVFREPAKFLLLLLFAVIVDYRLALAFLLFAFLVWVVGGQVASYFRRKGRIESQRAADHMALIQESLTMMRLVKVYLMELFNQARVERQLAGYANAQLKRYSGESFYRPLFTLLGLIAAVTLLLLAGTVILDGQFGVTGAMVLVTALICLYWPLVKWLDARRTLRRSRQSAKALFEFLDRPGTVGQAVEADFLPPLSKSLEFDKVTLSEPGASHLLLRGVSFSIQAGHKVALVGPDEMAKHALVYLIPRFLDPRDGEVRIDGKNLRWVNFDSLRAQTAMVLQHNLVFNDTVANNIGCGDPTYNLQRIIEAAKIAHAHHFIQKLPQGYATPIGDLGHALRTGEKFRIALARAILRDPALLIIEEPTESPDDNTKAMIDDTYARILPGRTVLFLAHRLSTIKQCDRVYLLHEGKIQASGDHRDLLAENDLYRHLQYLEFNEFAGLAINPTSIKTEGAA